MLSLSIIGIFVFVGVGGKVRGTGHGNQVNGMRMTNNGALLTCGIDDTLRRIDAQAEGISSVVFSRKYVSEIGINSIVDFVFVGVET